MNEPINWEDPTEVGARLVEAFAKCLATLLADAEHEGTYDGLIAGFRNDRVSLAQSLHGMTVRPNNPVPPPIAN